MKTTLRQLLANAMDRTGDTCKKPIWAFSMRKDNLIKGEIKCDLPVNDETEADEEFENEYGFKKCADCFVYTPRYIYLLHEYDGLVHFRSVPRDIVLIAYDQWR